MINEKEVKELVQEFDEFMVASDKYVRILEEDNNQLAEEVLYLTDLVMSSVNDLEDTRDNLDVWMDHAETLEEERDDLEGKMIGMEERNKKDVSMPLDVKIVNIAFVIMWVTSVIHYIPYKHTNTLIFMAMAAVIVGVFIKGVVQDMMRK